MKPISVTIDVACQISGLGKTKIYELIGSGRLETVTIGRRRLVTYASLERVLTGKAA